MVSLYESPARETIATLLVLVASLSAARGTMQLRRGLARAVPLDVVRGVRGVVISLTAAACLAAVLSAQTGFLVLGAIVLAEELYETGVLALIIRSGECRASEERRCAGSS